MSSFTEQYATAIDRQKDGEDMCVVYRISNLYNAILLKDIRDVITKPERIRKISGAQEFFEGLFLYDSEPIFLINTSVKLSLFDTDIKLAMILQNDKFPNMAISIDEIEGIIPLTELSPSNKGALLDYTIKDELIEAIFEVDDQTLIQLNLKKLIFE